jgi:hypothetical protein
VDEVMALVEDPYVNMDYERLNIAGFPGFLTNPNDILILQQGFGTALEGEDEEDARKLTASYLACRSSGTLGQVFALMSPNKVQQTVFARFPAFRSEADVRSFLESSLNNPAQEVMFAPVFEKGAILIPATGPESALEHSFYPDYPVAYIGTQSTDASGNVLETSNARDVLQQTGEVGGPPQTLGAVSLIRYPDGDRWYVHDSEVIPVVDSAKSAATQQTDMAGVQTGTAETEACVAEPMSAADLSRLLDDPDRYLDQEFGSDALTAEGVDLLEDIRTEPESLVLASVTQSSDDVMLVVPQEGVLPAAETYLKCWQDGTAAQAFSLMSPHMIVEYDSDVGLPRESNALEALLDAPARDLPLSDRLMPTFVLDNGAAVVVADTGGTHGYAQLPGDVEVAFVATDTNDRDDNPLIGGNIDDRSLDWSQGAADVDGRMSFGALTLIRYPGSAQWLVYDHWIELDPGTIE